MSEVVSLVVFSFIVIAILLLLNLLTSYIGSLGVSDAHIEFIIGELRSFLVIVSLLFLAKRMDVFLSIYRGKGEKNA